MSIRILRPFVLIAAIAFISSLAPAELRGQTAPKSEPAKKAMNSEELFDYLLRSTCWVTQPNGSGTGWVVDKEKRLIVTNHHVVNGFDTAKVYFPVKQGDSLQTDPEWYLRSGKAISGTVIDRHQHQDLALIQLDSLPAHVSALPIAAASAKPGQEVMTIGGHTKGSSGLWGWVDGKVRNVVFDNSPTGKLRVVESNLSTNSGNSGGPIVNNRGELVAVHFASNTEARTVTYHVDISELRTFLATAMTIVEPKDALGFVTRGDRRLSTGRNAMARDDFGAAAKLNPKLARAFLGRGMANHRLGDHATAILDLDEAVKLDSENFVAYYYRGQAQLAKKDFDKAAESLTQAIRINPKSPAAYCERGCVYYAKKDYAEAESDFGRAVELNPKFSDNWTNRALAREKLGKLDEALEDMQAGIKCSPKNAKIYSDLGYMLHRASRYEDAKQAHFKADELDLTNPIHAENVGHCLKMQDKYETAIKLFDLALKRAETYRGNYTPDTCLCSRGFCLRRLENFQASLADHNRSLKINSIRAETYYQRAWTYRALGQYDLVKEDFDKAVKLDASYANKESPLVVRTYSGYYRR